MMMMITINIIIFIIIIIIVVAVIVVVAAAAAAAIILILIRLLDMMNYVAQDRERGCPTPPEARSATDDCVIATGGSGVRLQGDC